MPEEKRRNKGRMELEKPPATTAVAKKSDKKIAESHTDIMHLLFVLHFMFKTIPTAKYLNK